ncbi:PD-(D/E)XK nuclease family protein [Desulfonatronum parangueonense]
MQIVLGHGFDTGSYPDALEDSEAVVEKVVVGPTGLLSILEIRLGLKGPSVHPAVRIGQYLARLRVADNGQRFYSRSFETDAWATANELLGWRDALVFGGWNGRPIHGMSGRLADLADVESLGQPELAPGLGERLKSIEAALFGATAVQLGISSLTLAEPEQEWPEPWLNLFQSLSLAGVARTVLEPNFPDAPGDLGSLQRAFHANSGTGGTVAGDGSLLLIAGQTEAEAAEALAEWLAADSEANKDVLIIKGMGSRLLDEALHARGLPRLGSDSGSRWRAALQVLLLALKNAWLPVNPQLLLEILTSPSSPVPRWAGRHFIQALQSHPGIGGELWIKARETALEEMQARLEQEKLAPAKAAKKMREFQANLDFWLGGRRHDPQTGMPAKEARRICAEVARLAASRGGHSGDPLLVAAMSQAMNLDEAIKASNLEQITRPQLKRMVDEVLQFSGTTPGMEAEAASWRSVKYPGQVWSPAKTIVWWRFLDQAQSRAPHIWTRAEQKALADAGVLLEDMNQQRFRQARSWRRPVILAEQQLILVMHRTEAADKTAMHPLWDEIKQAVAPEEADERIITVEAGLLRTRESLNFLEPGSRLIRRRKLAPLPLPQPRPDWDIPANTISFRARESASSLEMLLGCPLAWVLNYPAKIRMGALLSLPKEAQLTGILAHAVVERLFKSTGRCDPALSLKQAELIYEQLLPEIAAGLLQDGQAVERQRNCEQISHAAAALASLLDQCCLTVEGSEVFVTKASSELNTEFGGFLDLVLKNDNGEKVILDLKWSKTSKYKREELQSGLALQLAAYAWLLGETGKPLPAGYYMLSQAELLTSDTTCFPGQTAVEGPPLSDVWTSLVSQIRAAMTTLENGQALAPGAEPDADPKLKSCTFCRYTSLCGARREVEA